MRCFKSELYSYLYLNWNFYVHKFSCLTKSKVAKYMGVSNWDAIVYCENCNLGQGVKITSKVSSRKKHPHSRHRWWAIQLMTDIHKQVVKTNRQVEFQKTSPKTKSNDSFVYTPSQIKLTFIYTNFLSFWISWIKGHGLLFKFEYYSELPTSEHFY